MATPKRKETYLMHKRTVSAFVAVVAVIVLAAACSSSGSGSSPGQASASASAAPSASTISVSVTCPISGPNPVPECATSVQAYFDQVNAGGGVNGHKLKAVICDTQLNPVTEADCLKNAIANPSIVAFVGHGNLVVSPDTAIADIGTFTLTPAMSMAPNDFALSSYAGTTGGALGSILLQQLLLDKGFRKPGIIACSVTGCINDVKGAQAFYATKGITVKAVTAANT